MVATALVYSFYGCNLLAYLKDTLWSCRECLPSKEVMMSNPDMTSRRMGKGTLRRYPQGV